MAANVGSLLIEIGANVARLQSDMGRAHQVVANATKQMDRTFKALGVTVAGVFSVQAFQAAGTAIYQAGVKAQQLERAFKAISGAGAGQEMEFLRTTAAKLGLNFYELAEGYKGMAAAARGTAVEGQAVRDIFTATSEAATALGLSGEQTQGALLALSQMMSKGKISAEELRGQLGERLPGAFQVFAQALGVTTAKLDKMLEQGQVGLDVLPKVAAIWHQLYGSQASASAMNDAARATDRMAEAWTDFKAGLFQAEAAVDGIQTVTTAIKTLGGVINDVAGYAALPFYNIAAGIAVVKGEMSFGAWAGASSPEELRAALAQAGRANRDSAVMRSNRTGNLVGPGAALDLEAEFRAANMKVATPGKSDAELKKAATAIENLTAKLAAMNDVGTEGEGKIAALNKEYGNFAETLGKGHPLVKQYADVLAYANEHHGNTPAEVAKSTLAIQENIAAIEAEINATKAATDAYGNINREQFNALKAAADAEREYQEAILKGVDPVIAARERDLKALKAQNEAQTQNLEVLRSFYAEVASSLNRPQYKVQAVDREMAVYSAGCRPWPPGPTSCPQDREVATDAYDGMKRAAEDYAASAMNAAENVGNAFTNAMGGAEDALVNFARTGKLEFSDLADSIISDLIRIQVRQNITGPLSSALSGGGSGLFSFLGSFFHGGGVVGQDAPSFMRPVDPRVFVGAPRFHDGLASDEFPAILQKGETVIPKGGAAQGGTQKAVVYIKDSSGKQLAAPQTFNTNGARQFILDVVYDGMFRNESGRWR